MEGINIKTIIYIVIGAIWLIYNFMKKNSAAKKDAEIPDQTPSDDSEKEQEVITMLEELLGERRVEKKPIVAEAIKPIAPSLKSPIEKKKEGNSIQKRALKRPYLEEIKNVQEVSEVSEIIHEMDPRKMIIYSEILKRPHF